MAPFFRGSRTIIPTFIKTTKSNLLWRGIKELLEMWALWMLITNAVGMIVLSVPPAVKQPDLSVHLTKPKKLFIVQHNKGLSQVRGDYIDFGGL